MNIQGGYESTKEIYAGLGADVGATVEWLKNIPISMHYWQRGDIIRFESADSLSGSIQVTGNHPRRTRNPRELMAGIDRALSLTPGKRRINPHASYAIFTGGEKADRDALEPKHFTKWVGFTRKRGLGLGFNPTMFSHLEAENTTLSSEDPGIRKFWIDHCKACVRISQYFVEELGSPCSMNIWIPDDFKDTPTDRMSPGTRFKDSLDQILAMDYDRSEVLVAVESKVFGIDMESCTVGSHEFYMNYATAKGIMYLLDSDHFHPAEMISDKILSMLLFSDKAALHVSRPVCWDSDRVMLSNDEIREVAKKVVRNDPDGVLLTLDFFNASISRICARMADMRNMQKTLLYALLMPNEKLAKLREERRSTELMMEQEELKTYLFGDVWDYFYQIDQVPVKEQWFREAGAYEKRMLLKHG